MASAASAAAASVNKDIPPELIGVSVKELVKVIGESRANGNGVTPPGTPETPPKIDVSPCFVNFIYDTYLSVFFSDHQRVLKSVVEVLVLAQSD